MGRPVLPAVAALLRRPTKREEAAETPSPDRPIQSETVLFAVSSYNLQVYADSTTSSVRISLTSRLLLRTSQAAAERATHSSLAVRTATCPHGSNSITKASPCSRQSFTARKV